MFAFIYMHLILIYLDHLPEFYLNDQFIHNHFLIGLILNELDCLLAGCVNTGSWAWNNPMSALSSSASSSSSSSTSSNYRKPIRLVRNLLIKHQLDPRYRNSKPMQARICACYLPLIKLVLDHTNAFGPPGSKKVKMKFIFLILFKLHF